MDEKQKKYIGAPLDRIDGRLKVTGKAVYTAEFPVARALCGYPLQSTIAAGEITSIDASEAVKMPGVRLVVTHDKRLPLKPYAPINYTNRIKSPDPVLRDRKISYYGQLIGLVVAETYEQARAAARFVKFTYKTETPKIDFDEHEKNAYLPQNINANNPAETKRGDVEAGLKEAAVTLTETYDTPIEHHHPLEPHATLAAWEADDKLLVYETTQMVSSVVDGIASVFDVPKENIKVLAPFLGGGFGAKLQPRGHVVLTVMAAKMLKMPVKTALTRQMMQTLVGLRQHNRQKMRLGARSDGKLTALAHEIVTHTSVDDEFVEQSGVITRMMYDTPHSLVTHRVFTTNIQPPRWTRAPGEVPGSFALESAIDELAYKLKIDPIELRIKNEPKLNPHDGKPFASRALVECMRVGAKRFGWEKRKFEPRSVRQGNWLVGYGMAAASRGAPFSGASARVKLKRDERDQITAVVEMAATDIGTGSYTIIAQTAAEKLGLALAQIEVKIGDSTLPPTPGSGGSWGAGNYTNATAAACEKAIADLRAQAKKAPPNQISLSDLMRAAGVEEFQAETSVKQSEEAKKYAHYSFAAHFVEVWADEALGLIKIPRIVTTVASGRILNEKTARSQILGGVVWGIGQAKTEESVLDARFGSYATRTLADYHVPANLDVGEIDVFFLPEEDKIVNPLGVKGIGELGITSVGAAIANAVFNATGKRVRKLPITPDKLL